MSIQDESSRQAPPTPSTEGNRAVSPQKFRDTAISSELVTPVECEAAFEAASRRCGGDPQVTGQAVADELVRQEILTRFQAVQLLAGRRKLTLGQYRILDEVGQGGMGQVFKARHLFMGREVAVKVLPRSKANDETEAAFRREIELLGSLDHENLVHALDAGYDGQVLFLVTELVSGLDLRRHVVKYGRLDAVLAASVASQAARGILCAHTAGLVHRDVKPANILVREDGRVKVSDLGLAGSLMDGLDGSPGRIMGTFDYMAPEQIRSPEKAHQSADIYGLGCTLYFAVTGQVPFPGGDRQEKAKKQIHEEPTAILELAPDLDPGFAEAIGKLMAKEPSDRPPSAKAVLDLLAPWTPQDPIPLPTRSGKRGRDRRAGSSFGEGSGAGPSTSIAVGSGGPGRGSPWGTGEARSVSGWSSPDANRAPVDDGSIGLGSALTVSAAVGVGGGLVAQGIRLLAGDAWQQNNLGMVHFWSVAYVLSMATAFFCWLLLGPSKGDGR